MTTPQSSPKRLSKRSPRNSPRNSPKRKVLHERSKSQANTESLRLVKDDQNADADVFSATPFPTKPAHILRPVPHLGQGLPFAEGSSVSGDELPDRLLRHLKKNRGKGRAFSNASSRPATADARSLSLNRSVQALRQQFEDQAATSQASTPNGPLSPLLGPQAYRDVTPSLASLSRSASEEALNLQSDDPVHDTLRDYQLEESLPVIPASPRASRETRRSRHSRPTTPQYFTDQDSSSPNPNAYEESSSPNIIRLGESSSPNREYFPRPPSSPKEGSSNEDSSSPNVVTLRRSSSPFPRLIDVSSRSSTPNLIELGISSSPNIVQIGTPSSPGASFPRTEASDRSYDSSGTVRKHHEMREQSSYSDFPISGSQFNSSPPERALNVYASASSLALSEVATTSVHMAENRSQEEAQSTVESSPISIHYPVVRAPAPSTFAQINVPKRNPRATMSGPSPGEWNPTRLSMIPSEWSAERQSSIRPLTQEAQDEWLPDLPRPVYSRNFTNSTIRRVTVEDYNEASDNLSELRTSSLRAKTSGFLTLISSNSDSRHDSMRSSIRRMSSSGSLRSSLPGWARRYYSMGGSQLAVNLFGAARDSLPSSGKPSYGQLSSEMSLPETASASPADTDHLPLSIFRPRSRPRALQTQSMFEIEAGPLTSHPPPMTELAPEITLPEERRARDRRPRPKSLPLDFSDPRAHWAGAEEEALQQEMQVLESQLRQSRLAHEWSPHLYQDVRVGKTGQGRRNRWKAPSLEGVGVNEQLFGRRNMQIWAFAFGFIFPVFWFIAAFLPLPPETSTLVPEKQRGTVPSRMASVRTYSDNRMSRQDLEAQIRMEQKQATADEIRFENARWWRNLNRFMCAVGVVIIVLVITLAVLGTRNGGL